MRLAFLISVVVMPAALMAAHAAGSTKDKTKPKADGLICETGHLLESRLRSYRVCMTKDQWERTRREDLDAAINGLRVSGTWVRR